jgi:hypothetical protein
MRLSFISITRVLIVAGLLLAGIGSAQAQNPLQNVPGANSLQGMGRGGGAKKDSLKHRTGFEDTLTLTYRYLDSTHIYHMDTSVADIDKFYPLPANYRSLGNTGNPAKSLIYQPNMNAGWDPGFHSFDVYRFTWETMKFYTTTRPFTEAEYFIGSSNEQDISVTHTQNINQHWNFAVRYRLTGGPGTFQNQKANLNNYALYTWYESPRKRYHLYGGLLANNLKNEENGGFTNNNVLFDTLYLGQRFSVPTHLGSAQTYQANIFNTTLTTGDHYSDVQFLLRQQYDIGQQDSIVVNDSTTYYLFYARLRLQHTIQYEHYGYEYIDNSADSVDFYQSVYGFLSPPLPGFYIEDKWSRLINDLSLFQYPVAKNPSQYLTEGISLEDMKGTFFSSIQEFYNVFAHGEYRNQTRNKKWDLELNGKLYLEGYNVGNYQAHASIARSLGRRIGYLEAGFENTNRTPSFVFQPGSSFNFGTNNPKKLINENNTQLYGFLWQSWLKLKLEAHYYLMNNYTYLNDYHGVAQYTSPFNILQISAIKEFNLSKRWVLYGEYYVQQTTGDAPVRLPLFYTRDRLVYQGRFYRKLNLAMGLEVKYATPYKEDMYSPLLGQFFPQLGQKDSPYGTEPILYSNRPDIAAFVHFRIRTFYLVVRAENLNTLNFSPKFGFNANNQPYVGYADPGLIIHFGVLWGFVN